MKEREAAARSERDAALGRERRRQMRGLLWLAGAVLIFILWRGRSLHMFHAGWWRL